MKKVQNTLATVPKEIQYFFLRAILFLIAWKILYLLILSPIHIPDDWLSRFTTVISSKLIQSIYPDSFITIHQDNDLYAIAINGKKSIGLGYACNALELYILYIGYIICRPAAFTRQFYYGITGIGIILLLNVIRVSLLCWLFLYDSSYGDFAHKYVFNCIVYFCIYWLWHYYSLPMQRKNQML
ncbi:MAG: hypothetical protein ACOVNY_12030 [Chitinophagaceae bacterium]